MVRPPRPRMLQQVFNVPSFTPIFPLFSLGVFIMTSLSHHPPRAFSPRLLWSRRLSTNAGKNGASQWESERNALRSEMAEQQKSVKTTMSALEAQISTLKILLRDLPSIREI